MKARILAILLLCLSGFSHAESESFVVEDIRLHGLQRVDIGAVFTYLPIQVGEELEQSRIPGIVRGLYQNGAFEDISLSREGNVLHIFVKERPTIASLSFTGNDDLPTDELKESLKTIGLAEGEILDRSVLGRIQQELEGQYFSRGKYSVKVHTFLTPLPRNRVDIKFVITEGEVATIKKINIVGNTAFTDKELVKRFELADNKPFWKFWGTDDQYSKVKLESDIETLKSYYLDRGYAKFEVVSSQVTVTPDKNSVFITVHINEGEKFTIEDVKLSGELVIERDELEKLLYVKQGDQYSQALITMVEEQIAKRLSVDGYSFAKVRTVPDIDERSHRVDLTFYVDPGKRVYVRRINFSGNTKTADEVMRREVRQMESAWYNSNLVELSKLRLDRLGYFDNIEVDTTPVPGTDDQVDIDVSVNEGQFGQFVAGIGYGQGSGFSVNASVSQENFLGSGKRVSFSFNKTSATDSYSFGYTNPYYTINGISRGFRVYYRQTDFEDLDSSSTTTSSWGGGINYGVPISEVSRLNFGMAVDSTELRLSSNTAAEQVKFFFDAHEENVSDDTLDFTTMNLTSSWTYNTLNRAIFPDRGWQHSVNGEMSLPGLDLQFYKLQYEFKKYTPIFGGKGWAFKVASQFSYADGYGEHPDGSDERLPYFENYFTSFGQLRGFERRDIGPKQVFRLNSRTETGQPIDNRDGGLSIPSDSQYDEVVIGNSIGGNARYTGGLELYFPVPFFPDLRSVRTSTFIDIGNVWDTRFDYDNYSDLLPEEIDKIDDYSDYGDFRASAGVTIQWLSPLGPMSFSLSKPIKDQEGDSFDTFDFAIGRTF